MLKQDFVVRFAGEGGQGMVTAAEAMAQAAAQVGYHVMTFVTFPSQIMGGPTWTQARISTTPALSNGDDIDVLVAFNEEAYETHKDEVTDGGVIIYDSAVFQIDDDSSLGVAFDELGRSTGNTRAANMVILGALAKLVNWPEEYLVEFVKARFSRGRADDETIIEQNIHGLSLGKVEIEKSVFSLDELAPPNPPDYEQIVVKGNDLLAIGAIAAGLDYYVGYPISPATTILLYMEKNLIGPGKFVYQASSEIEAVNTVMGAGYAGARAMTATSGPGFSLMSEGIGAMWMMEIPGVIVDVQRGGPATGLPTKTEQSDLFAALHPAHGDASMPVIAPGTVEECFYAAIKAIEWAERYQGPVMLLSEHMMADRTQNIPKPDVSSVKQPQREVYSGSNGYLRYEGTDVSPMPLPGGPGSYIANASEHDPMGDTTHLPIRHVENTERRFNKLKLLEDGTYESQNSEEAIAVMPWGGSKGPMQEAYVKLMENGEKIGWYYTMFMNPLPPALLEELRTKDLVIVPEVNFQGQFSSILRSEGVKAVSITQYTGLPFKTKDLVKQVTEKAEAQRKVAVSS